eukprot:TRINITY_DN5780_c0_g1_i2.p1 TRINITY_DN5780_c0_g1~~TRINITY_DN5780_c0_g1_i2.p1  ORF type:complete len:145 (-),score=23.70 TRINITY_DN5780_c0_g1_i2:85-519(-)
MAKEASARIDTIDPKYSLIVAIDFGTAATGYAFAWTSVQPKEINANRPWTDEAYVKTPTCILLGSDLSVQAFGKEARNKFSTLSESERSDHYLFERFKMALFADSGTTREVLVKAINCEKTLPVLDLVAKSLMVYVDIFEPEFR